MKMKLTEKNYGSIMDKVNRFLAKSTIRDDGLRNMIVGYKNVDIGEGQVIEVAIWEERQCLTPFIGGKCFVHPMYVEEKNRTFKFGNYKNPILAISSVMDSSCIALQEGCIIEINSTKMRIVSIDTNIKTLSPTTYNFYNKEYTKEERINTIHERLRNHYSNYICENSYYSDLGSERYRKVSSDFVDVFCGMFITTLEELSKDRKEFSFEVDNEVLETNIRYKMKDKLKNPIVVKINFETFEIDGKVGETYLLDGNEYDNLFSILDCFYAKYFEVENEEKGEEQEYDYDYSVYDDYGCC